MNQINIRGDTLGVVNTRTAKNIAVHLTQLADQKPDLAHAFKRLTEEIILSPYLPCVQKQEAIDFLSDITEIQAIPRSRRSSVVTGAALDGLTRVLSHAPRLALRWHVIRPHIS